MSLVVPGCFALLCFALLYFAVDDDAEWDRILKNRGTQCGGVFAIDASR